MQKIQYVNPVKSVDYLQVDNLKTSYLKDVEKNQLPLFDINNKSESLPIIIDYGSSTFKSVLQLVINLFKGWGNSQQPDLVLRSVINRTKDSKSTLSQCIVGTQFRDIDIFKGNYQSVYERNLIYHTGAFEHLNDYIFNELHVGGDGAVNHPLIITEPCANIEQMRTNMLEQLFECYNVPSIMLGVDALFGTFAQNDLNTYFSQTRLVINFGDSATHIIPIINGQVWYSNIKRVNIGGQQSLQLLYKNVQLRHTHLKQYLTYGLIEKIHRQYTSVASDYSEQLKYLRKGVNMIETFGYTDEVTEQNNKIFKEKDLINQFKEPIIISFEGLKQSPLQIIDEEEVKRKQEIRNKQSDRLREALAKKKDERQTILLQQLRDYESLTEKFKLDPIHAKFELENIVGNKGMEELKKRIKILKVKAGLIPKESLDEDKYQYVDIPDSQLTPEQINQKRYQLMMKQAQIAKCAKKEEENKQKEEINRFKEQYPEKYLASLYDRRSQFQRKIEDRKKKQQEMNTRNSRFNQRRMQALAYLGSQDQQGKEDTFGMKDEDWDIYRGIARELDSDDENAELKLQEIEVELREIDPCNIILKYIDIVFDDKVLESKANIHQLGMDLYEITLSVDRVKCNEVYFQPSLVGVDQCGIIDAILLSIKTLDKKVQKALLENILLIGGGAHTVGLKERLQIDLQKEIDPQHFVNIKIAQDGVFDPWRGMQNFYLKHTPMFKQFSMTLDEYQECGAQSNQLFKVHPFSNILD